MQQEADNHSLKDLQPILSQLKYSGLSCPPKGGMVYLVERNLEQVMDLTLAEVAEFQTSNAAKLVGLRKLLHLIIIANSRVTQYVERILRILYKYLFQFDEPEFVEIMKEIAAVIGYVVEFSILCPLVAGHVKEEIEKSTSKTVENMLVVFESALTYLGKGDLLPQIEAVCGLLTCLETVNLDSLATSLVTLQIVDRVVTKIGPTGEMKDHSSTIFNPYLAVQATIVREQQESSTLLSNTTEALALACGYPNAASMYSEEVKEILEKMYLDKGYSKWDKYSKDRFKFSVIVRFCSKGIAKYMEIVVDVISKCTEPAKDNTVKFDMLELLDFLVSTPETQMFIKDNCFAIVKKIICQVLVWRAGKPNTKIRKAGIICFSKMIDFGLCEADQVYQVYEDLLACLTNCMSDDWAPDVRFLACELMKRLINLLNSHLTAFQLSNLYKILLERLDDAQDKIRIQITHTLVSFLKCKNVMMSDSTMKYVIQTCFIHLDDRNEEIQRAIFEFMKFAITVDMDLVESEAQKALEKQKFPMLTEALLKHIKLERERMASEQLGIF